MWYSVLHLSSHPKACFRNSQFHVTRWAVWRDVHPSKKHILYPGCERKALAPSLKALLGAASRPQTPTERKSTMAPGATKPGKVASTYARNTLLRIVAQTGAPPPRSHPRGAGRADWLCHPHAQQNRARHAPAVPRNGELLLDALALPSDDRSAVLRLARETATTNAAPPPFESAAERPACQPIGVWAVPACRFRPRR